MPINPRKPEKKPDLKRDDPVIVVDTSKAEPDGSMQARISVVGTVNNGRVKAAGETGDFNLKGERSGKRLLRVPASLRAAWDRSPFMRGGKGRLTLNQAALDLIDLENEKTLPPEPAPDPRPNPPEPPKPKPNNSK